MSFIKSDFYIINRRGFREQAWQEPPTSKLEPELDWWQEEDARKKVNRVGHH